MGHNPPTSSAQCTVRLRLRREQVPSKIGASMRSRRSGQMVAGIPSPTAGGLMLTSDSIYQNMQHPYSEVILRCAARQSVRYPWHVFSAYGQYCRAVVALFRCRPLSSAVVCCSAVGLSDSACSPPLSL